jgi:AraC family transcriptional regulator of arabinose operon
MYTIDSANGKFTGVSDLSILVHKLRKPPDTPRTMQVPGGPILAYGYAAYRPGHAAPTFRAGENVWNISYTLSGRVREILPSGETFDEPHDFMLLKPGGVHGWEVPRDAGEFWKVVWFIFIPKPDWLPLLDLPEAFPKFCRLPLAGRKHDQKIRRALLQAYRHICTPGGGALAMNAIERSLLWLHAEFSDSGRRFDPRARAAMETMSRRLTDPLSLPELAKSCGLSVSRLGELFLEATGQTPRNWLERARLKHAQDLLATTSLPVKLVAAACGYKDQRHFATRFRRHFGLTPGQRRERNS